MKWYMFAVKDTGVGAFHVPISVRHRGEALRAFTTEIQRADETNQLYRHAKDFELWSVGLFDDETGMVHTTECEFVLSGVDARLTER